MNATSKIIRLARQLFVENPHEPMTYFALLQKTASASEWPILRDELILSLNNGQYGNDYTLGKIYVAENMHDRLLALVQRGKNAHLTQSFEQSLVPKYRAELVEVYESILHAHLKHCNGRNDYATACDYLRKMKSLGGHDAAQTMVN